MIPLDYLPQFVNWTFGKCMSSINKELTVDMVSSKHFMKATILKSPLYVHANDYIQNTANINNLIHSSNMVSCSIYTKSSVFTISH